MTRSQLFQDRGNAFRISILILMVGLLITGCSVESKLVRSYKGKSFSVVIDRMGAPTTTENLVGGGTIRSYIKKRMLKETPINTGQFKYDAFNSPKVLKTEVTQFFVSQSGLVNEVRYSCEYSK
ncbi:MAG: hypothetical protein WCP08_11205 [Prolixibacteraceae bacterium]